MYQLVKQLILPPTPLLLLAMAGLVAARRRGNWGWWCAVAAVSALYLSCTPLVSDALRSRLQSYSPLSLAEVATNQADGIVVLSGDTADGPEYGGDTVGPLTLTRLRYAALLHQVTDLPILVSGGAAPGRRATMAALMQEALADSFHVPVRWLEDRSINTRENARYSADILKKSGVRRIYLVTHAWHMRRAIAAFEAAGLKVIPAPTGYTRAGPIEAGDLLPSARAIEDSHYAIYELLGGLYYHFFKVS